MRDAINEVDIDVAFLPPNMTSELQALNGPLEVNGPLEAHIRAKRVNRLYDAFQVYKVARTENNKIEKSVRQNLDFDPPNPTMTEGIQDLILLFKDQFNEEKFKSCTNRSFIKTGTLLMEYSGPVIFVGKYKKEILCGSMLVIPEGTMDEVAEKVIVSPDSSEPSEEESVERALFLYFVNNNCTEEDDSIERAEETN